MKPLDTIGKEFSEGQMVHIPLNGVYNAIVKEIREGTSLISGEPPKPPMVILEFRMQVACSPQNGRAASTYIIIDPPKDIPPVDKA